MANTETSENRALRAEVERMRSEEARRRKEKKEGRLADYEARLDALEIVTGIKPKPAPVSATALEVADKPKKKMRPEVSQGLSLAGGGGVIVLLTELVRWLSTM